MLNDYIKELIASNNRVIIPNFGAFLLRATSKNKNKKELADKVQDIYFSPFLKFNDELLVNHIIKKENTSQKEAMDKIVNYVKNIEDSVRKDGVYKIEGLGEFFQDDQGKIQFKVVSSGAKAPEKKTPSASSAKKTTQGKKATTVNEKAGSKSKETTASEKKSEPAASSAAKAQKDTGKQKEEKKQEPAAKQPVSKSTAGSRGAKTPPPKRPAAASSSGGKKGSNKGLVLAIVIGVPVAAVFVWAMLNFDTVEKIFSKKEHKTEQIAEKKTPEQEKKAKEREEKKQEKKDEQTKGEGKADQEASPKETTKATQKESDKTQVKKASRGEKKYYIVAGSFRNLEYAKKFNQDLIKQGYNSELIGERNGMHAVSYNSYKNKSQAQRELQEMRDKGLQVWLLYY